jgi:hypothetical protein
MEHFLFVFLHIPHKMLFFSQKPVCEHRMLGYTREIVFWILLTFFNFVLCNFHNSSYKPTRPSQKCVAWSYGDSLLIVQVHILSACAANNRNWNAWKHGFVRSEFISR